MNGDFGAEVDAALNTHLESLRTAADEARARIERGVEALPQGEDMPVTQPSPVFFRDPTHGPAVSFEGMDDEYELEADAEGIPLPEENL